MSREQFSIVAILAKSYITREIFVVFTIYVLQTRSFFFFFNDPAPPEISPLPLPAALPISAGLVSHPHIRPGYEDPQGLAELARLSAAVTTEFENVPAAALNLLAAQRPVSPAGSSVAIAQDRAQEKAHFVRCGVPCAPYAVIETPAQLAAVHASLLPGILKTARMGYDGKGQVRVKNAAELATAWEQLGRVACVLEKMLPLAHECSVIVARGRDGSMVNLPVQRNLHREGILSDRKSTRVGKECRSRWSPYH